MVNLQQLRYVAAVSETKSFTKAADAAFVVQSALSQQVRKFEAELGVQLFARTTRSVTLTPAGEMLMPLVRRVLAGVEQIQTDAEALRGTLSGRLTVGVMEVPPDDLDIAALIAGFHTRYPHVSVTLRSGGIDQLLAAVRDRRIDIAIVGSSAETPRHDLLDTRPLMTESLVAVLPDGHPLAAGTAVPLRELAAYPFIDFPPGYGLRHETDRGFTGVARRVAFEVTRVDQVVQFVRRGLGVALLPESVARSRAHDGAGLTLLSVTGADLRRQVNLVTPHPANSPIPQAFIRVLDAER